MATIRTTLTAGLLLTLGAGGAATALIAARDAPADPPMLVDTVQQRLASAERLFIRLNTIRAHDSFGNRDGFAKVALRADLPAKKLAIDSVGQGYRYLYAEGDLTFHSSGIGSDFPPRQLDLAEPIVDALLGELDAGLANSVWTREDPPMGVYGGPIPNTGYGGEWWRVDLPFVWDDTFRIYLLLKDKPRCLFDYLLVLHADADEIVRVQHPSGGGNYDLYVGLCDRVHWDPDFTASQYGSEDPFVGRMYRWEPVYDDEYGEF